MFGEEVVNVQTSKGSSRTSKASSSAINEDGVDEDNDPLRRRVTFEAFNQRYNLTLRPTVGLLSPSFGVILRDGEGNVTQRRDPDANNNLADCFYRGTDAAFDLCRGLVSNIVLISYHNQNIQKNKRRGYRVGHNGFLGLYSARIN